MALTNEQVKIRNSAVLKNVLNKLKVSLNTIKSDAIEIGVLDIDGKLKQDK